MASGLLAAFPELDLGHAAVGVWGRKAAAGQVLRDRDRIECTGPCRLIPRWQGASGDPQAGRPLDGLVARQRAGGKAGY